jgi:hypothetical protein
MERRFVLDGEEVVVSGNTRDDFAKNFARTMVDRQLMGEEDYPEGVDEDTTASDLKEYGEELWDEGQEVVASGEAAVDGQTITARGNGEITITISSQKKGNTGAFLKLSA